MLTQTLRLILSLTLLTLAAGCAMDDKNGLVNDESLVNPADYPNKPGTVYGAWLSASQFGSNEVTESVSMYLNEGSVAFVKACDWGTHSVKVSVESSARASGFAIEIMSSNQESASITRDGVVYYCKVSIERGVFDYTLSGDSLRVDFPFASQTFIRQ